MGGASAHTGIAGRKSLLQVKSASIGSREGGLQTGGCEGAGTIATPFGRGHLPVGRITARLPGARSADRGEGAGFLRTGELPSLQTAVPGRGQKDHLPLTGTRQQKWWAVTPAITPRKQTVHQPLAGRTKETATPSRNAGERWEAGCPPANSQQGAGP